MHYLEPAHGTQHPIPHGNQRASHIRFRTPEMDSNLSNRIQAILLAVATVVLVLLAVLNFRQETQFQQPDDQVWWIEASHGEGLVAQRILPGGAGELAGLKASDLL